MRTHVHVFSVRVMLPKSLYAQSSARRWSRSLLRLCICLHVVMRREDECLHVRPALSLTHCLEQDPTWNRPILSLPTDAITVRKQLPAVLLGSYACSLTSASTAMKPLGLKVKDLASLRMLTCNIHMFLPFVCALLLLIVLHSGTSLICARVRMCMGRGNFVFCIAGRRHARSEGFESRVLYQNPCECEKSKK